MKLIVGLGNPGSKYEKTRHNIGFEVINYLQKDLGITNEKEKFQGLISEKNIDGEKVLFLKPQTFMNLSGNSIIEVINFYKLNPKTDLVVIYDDMDLPVGKLRVKEKGSSGGHNGIKSIIANLGTEEFNRIKVGIGHPESHNIIDYVLKRPSKEEEPLIYAAQKNAVEALKVALSDSFNKAMTMYNK